MPLHFCHEIPQFPKYEYILPNSHCVLTQLVYLIKNGIISKLRCYCAQEHHFTPSSTQFLLSQINPICTMNFFLGILYVCNGGWILTVVRARQFPHLQPPFPLQILPRKLIKSFFLAFVVLVDISRSHHQFSFYSIFHAFRPFFQEVFTV